MLPPLSTLPRNLEQPSLLGSHVATSLLLRGGSQIAQQAETVDSLYTRSAIGYFNNLRVPAAVLMSIIMKVRIAADGLFLIHLYCKYFCSHLVHPPLPINH